MFFLRSRTIIVRLQNHISLPGAGVYSLRYEEEGKEDEMWGKVQKKTGKAKDELVKWLKGLG